MNVKQFIDFWEIVNVVQRCSEDAPKHELKSKFNGNS